MTDNYVVPCLILVATVLGFGAGSFSESLRHSHEDQGAPLSVSEIRSELTARCVAVPDVIAEIQAKLPDNEDGLITPTIVRAVLKDVVSHC